MAKSSSFESGRVRVYLRDGGKDHMVDIPAKLYDDDTGLRLAVHPGVVINGGLYAEWLDTWTVTEVNSGMFISTKNSNMGRAVMDANRRLAEMTKEHINDAIFKKTVMTKTLPTTFTLKETPDEDVSC